ncbi:MAG: mechanosensitive ion channel [Prochlorococcaceae cyanobacterium]
MITLLGEIIGWLGYLERGTVLLQLLVLLAALLGTRALGQQRRLPGSWDRWLGPAATALMLLATLVLALARQPFALLATFAAIHAGWQGIGLLHQALAHHIPAEQVQQLESQLIRPVFLLLAALALIQQVGNVRNLALIPMGRWFGTEVMLGELVTSLVILYLLVMASGPPAAGLAWLMQRGLAMDDGNRRATALILRYGVVTLGIIWALDHIGLNRAAILTVAGGLSVGLGFGIKEVFSNFVSGLWLLFEGSVRPGEVLFVDGDPCEVRRLGLRAAVLWRDRDNAELVIPNQTFFTTTTTTYTGSDRLRRSQVLVGAAYHHDPAAVIALLEATALGCPRVLQQPPPKGLVLHYGASAVEYALRFWIANPMDNVGICSEVQSAIWQAFRQQGIEIPFPQQVQYQVAGAPPQQDDPSSAGSR